jgi:pyruvate/2-oxoglutarate dehydrogenase complex dihydrolipoamide acyltransferase (E2) component
MTVKLSCDRRVVDEAVAAQLLQTFRHYMQTPVNMLL